MADHLDSARKYVSPPVGMESAEGYAAATAHAALALVEVAQGIEMAVDRLHNALTKAQGAHAPHDGAVYPGEGSDGDGGCVVEPPPAPADTPQVGEVWEGTAGIVRVKLDRRCSSPTNLRHAWLWHATVVAVNGPSAWRVGDPVGMVELDQSGWRRVSPAPAPLTEREVAAEVEGVEPATDEQIATWEGPLNASGLLPTAHRIAQCLIARVRAEQARAEQFHEWMDGYMATVYRLDDLRTGLQARAERAEAEREAAHRQVDDATELLRDARAERDAAIARADREERGRHQIEDERDAAVARAERAEMHRRNISQLVREREAALKRAEAEVERMRPVVELVTADGAGLGFGGWHPALGLRITDAIRTYRAAQEATDGE